MGSESSDLWDDGVTLEKGGGLSFNIVCEWYLDESSSSLIGAIILILLLF